MTAHKPHRGGATVGFVTELDAVEAGAVRYLRLWGEGAVAQRHVRTDFASALGVDAGQRALQAFAELCDHCLHYGRRPLVRHQVMCRCLGADEACFANFIAAAAEGDREDAILIATLLVRADMAMCLFDHAATVGHALRRMTQPGLHASPSRTVH
ncbi:MAG: hypothetical protein Q7J44_15425 [Pseudotabrizicola sp.]|uniref:hypothetical protein n=1 Tax=Pseudotabrizicola sp. TaxID=2939647 RepID=UPI0027214C85|nr:hypothetical protein [Pseudotabrizicola sp.]MDO9639928.1 hypothetical protein [Pseudotabrizicola sp.]